MTIHAPHIGMKIAAAAATLAVALAWTAAPAAAEDEERRIVRKIRVDCDGADCTSDEEIEELLDDAHAFAWASGDGPMHFRFRAIAGGGFLGIQLADLTPELRAHFGVAESAGVMISKVVDDSPAERAGLLVGDIVTAVDGDSIGSGAALSHAILRHKGGETVLLEVWRDGKVQSLTATLEEREERPFAGMHHAFVLECDDDEADCSHVKHRMLGGSHGAGHPACGGEGPCEVRVRCDDDGECECTVNGEPADCAEMRGLHD